MLGHRRGRRCGCLEGDLDAGERQVIGIRLGSGKAGVVVQRAEESVLVDGGNFDRRVQDGRPLGSEKADEDVFVGPRSDEEGW